MDLLARIDALLVTSPINIRYLTGFIGMAPDEREAYALLTKKKTFLFTNALYLEQAKTTNATVVETSREEPFAKKLAEILKRSHPALQGETLKRVRLGFEETDLTVAEYQKLKKELRGVRLVPTKNRIENLRMIKRDDEIENIRQAAKITDDCFTYLTSFLKPGVAESVIAWEIESFFRTRGVQSAFSPIVAFGSRSSQPHYSFARYYLAKLQGSTLRKQDVALLDFGAQVNGYCSDMTRVVFVGKPKDEWRRAYETVLGAQEAALEYLQRSHPDSQGETFQERSGAAADRTAQAIIKKTGFPVYPHSLGHGVGLAIHEVPRLTMKKNVTLKPGMVVTVEPAIYVEGSYGIRIEDLVLLKKDGVEILSKSSKELIIL